MIPRNCDTSWLVAQAQTGDRGAREAVLARYRSKIEVLVERRFSGLLERLFEADDVIQETLLRLHNGLDGFEDRGRGSFAAWVRICVDSTIADLIRRATAERRGGGRVRRSSDLGDSRRIDELAIDRSPSPSKFLLADELSQHILESFRRLAPPYRRVLDLWLVRGASYGEIQRELGYGAESAARAAVSRALTKLRAELDAIHR
jgi:RNA polymerase sigma factor (sigma-70 family)